MKGTAKELHRQLDDAYGVTQRCEALVEQWNKLHPSRTPVAVRKDDGSVFETRTRSDAWLPPGGHTAVIMVEGINGGHWWYPLERVEAI